MDDIEFHIPEKAADLNNVPFVPAYDPTRKTVVHVTPKQGQVLNGAGYGIGDEAHIMAENDNFYGAAKAFGKGVLSGGSLGLADLAMPHDAQVAGEALKKLHPYANMAGDVLGMGAADVGIGLATGPAGVYAAMAARVAANGVRGASEEIKRAKINSEPVQAERVLQGMGVGALFGAAGEGLGAVTALVPKLGKGFLGKLDKVYRTGAVEEVEGSLLKYRRALSDDKQILAGAAVGGSFIPGGHKIAAAILGADKVAVRTLNNLHYVNSAIENFGVPVAKRLGQAADVFLKAGVDPEIPFYVKDPEKHFNELSPGVKAVARDPFNFTDAVFSGMKDSLKNHTALQSGIANGVLQTAALLHSKLPKSPYDPGLGMEPYKPTQKQMRDWLDAYHTVTQFPKAMQTPTPDKIEIAKQVMPEQFKTFQDILRGHLAINGTKGLTNRQKQGISLILGIPVSPSLQQHYLQNLQVTAPPPPPGKPPAAAGGGLGVHGAQAVTMRDAPEAQKLTLGATF